MSRGLHLILVSCLLLVADAYNTCWSLLLCERPIRDETVFAGTSVIFAVEDTLTLDRICGKLPAFRTCASNLIDQCGDEDDVFSSKLFTDIMDYSCKGDGRKVALATMNTKCPIDDALQSWFSSHALLCVNEYLEKSRALGKAKKCPLKLQLEECVKSGVDKKCGTEMGALVEEIWFLLSQHYRW